MIFQEIQESQSSNNEDEPDCSEDVDPQKPVDFNQRLYKIFF